VTPGLAARLDGAAALFFDGTLWEDDEMIREGLGAKTGRRMGHLAMNGPDGSIAALAPLAVRRRIFVHINNTNPVLRPDSAERAAADAAGWAIGADGMEVTA
jgi:pyrroloquinoline quinone biosynthesis protein B